MTENVNNKKHKAHDELENILPEIVKGELADIKLGEALKDPKIRKALAISVSQTVSQHRSPLPPSKELHEIENICPGATNRIITMAEKEQETRHKLSERTLNGFIESDRRHTNYALLSLVIMVVVGCACLYLGFEKAPFHILYCDILFKRSRPGKRWISYRGEELGLNKSGGDVPHTGR